MNTLKQIAECKAQNKMIVVAKNVFKLSDLELSADGTTVSKYTGLLFDIWNEIASANNYS